MGGLHLLSPWAALVSIVALVAVGALAVARRRLARVRRVLQLAPQSQRELVLDLLCLAAAAALLAVAAMQPAFVERTGTRVRTDAQAFVVVDTSESMLAAARPGAATRFERARAAALRVRAALAGVETGLATMTDRVLPDLLPAGDQAAFDTTAARALAIDSPPPQRQGVVATSLGSLADIAAGGFFAPSARHRVLVVLTDGETRPYDQGAVAASLAASPPVSLVIVHVGSPHDRVYAGSKPDPAYHADPAAAAQLAALAGAAGGKVFGAGRVDDAGKAALAALGSGPTALRGEAPKPVTLAPWIALAALVPLLLLAARRARFAPRGSRGDTIALS